MGSHTCQKTNELAHLDISLFSVIVSNNIHLSIIQHKHITQYIRGAMHTHWNEYVFILMKFPSLLALKVVVLTTFCAINDENFVQMTSSSRSFLMFHYNDVIMGPIASQITSLTIVYSIVYSDADQRKHQSSASLAFVRGIHRGPVNSPHKWPVMRKMFPFDDVIMYRGLVPVNFPIFLMVDVIGNKANTQLPQRQWSNPENYG